MSKINEEIICWFQSEVVNTRELSTKEKTAKVTGISLGVLSSVVSYFLAAEFGRKVGVGKSGEIILGVVSALPLAALGSVTGDKVFSSISKQYTDGYNAVMYEGMTAHQITKKIRQLSMGLLGICGGIPLTFVTHQVFKKYNIVLAVIMDVPTFIAKTVAYGWASNEMYKIAKQQFNKFYYADTVPTPISSTGLKRFTIKAHLRKTAAAVARMGNDEFEVLKALLMSSRDDLVAAGQALEELFELSETGALERKSSTGSKIFQVSGAMIGFLASYVLEPIAEQAFMALFSMLGADEMFATTVTKFLAYFSVIAVGALMSYTSTKVFEQFYDLCKSLPGALRQLPQVCSIICSGEGVIDFKTVLQKALTFMSVAFAVTSSFPRIDLALDYLDLPTPFTQIIIASIALASVSKDFWSLEKMRSSFFGKTNDERSLFSKKILIMINQIDDLSDRHVDCLYEKYYLKYAPVRDLLSEESDMDAEDEEAGLLDSESGYGLSSYAAM